MFVLLAYPSIKENKVMARVVICTECKKEIEVRSGFAHHTLSNHKSKEHKLEKREKNG